MPPPSAFPPTERPARRSNSSSRAHSYTQMQGSQSTLRNTRISLGTWHMRPSIPPPTAPSMDIYMQEHFPFLKPPSQATVNAYGTTQSSCLCWGREEGREIEREGESLGEVLPLCPRVPSRVEPRSFRTPPAVRNRPPLRLLHVALIQRFPENGGDIMLKPRAPVLANRHVRGLSKEAVDGTCHMACRCLQNSLDNSFAFVIQVPHKPKDVCAVVLWKRPLESRFNCRRKAVSGRYNVQGPSKCLMASLLKDGWPL